LALGRAAEAVEEDSPFGVMSMVPRITDMKYSSGYRVWLRFDDGKEGEVDLQDELWGEVFEPLQQREHFKLVYLDRELNTIRRENGADFAPEFLYAKLTA
jgi:Protein of unknown function (DUF2442)